jgi:anaerobic selenocysteine-containing dehydrogenase
MARGFPPLQVVGFIATRRGDAERGPLLLIHPADAEQRLITDGELVWVYGPRRHELAPVVFDETLPRAGVVVRDLAGLAVTEIVRLVKHDVRSRPILTSALVKDA